MFQSYPDHDHVMLNADGLYRALKRYGKTLQMTMGKK